MAVNDCETKHAPLYNRMWVLAGLFIAAIAGIYFHHSKTYVSRELNDVKFELIQEQMRNISEDLKEIKESIKAKQ